MPSETLNTGFRRHLFTVELSPSGGGGFSEDWVQIAFNPLDGVLIPMWWGGFSEAYEAAQSEYAYVLIPMWWGGFSEPDERKKFEQEAVLIPMWWGGFSENI